MPFTQNLLYCLIGTHPRKPLFYDLRSVAATAAAVVACAQDEDGDDDQPNGIIFKQTAEAVIHGRILHRSDFREALRFPLPTIKI